MLCDRLVCGLNTLSAGASQRTVVLVLPREGTMTTGPQTFSSGEGGFSLTTAHCPMHSCAVGGHVLWQPTTRDGIVCDTFNGIDRMTSIPSGFGSGKNERYLVSILWNAPLAGRICNSWATESLMIALVGYTRYCGK